MGGGGNSAAPLAAAAQTDPEFTGQMRNFEVGQGDLIQSQLNMSGLGNFIDPTQFQQSEVPIFKNPDEIELYLKSLGKTPAE